MHELLNQYRDELLRQDKSTTTITSYLNDITLFVKWREESYGEAFDAARVVQREIAEYRNHLLNVKRCSPATVNRRLASLCSFFGWLEGCKRVKSNPAAGVKGIALIDPGVQSLTNTELRRLMREVHVHGNRLHVAICEILAGTAIRVGELVALTVPDLALSERKGVLTVRSGKGRASRQIPLNTDVRRAVANWLEARRTFSGDFLLIGQRRGKMTTSGVWRIVKKYATLAGIPDMTVHQLRHTAIRRLVRPENGPGVDLAVVARISGHRNLKTLLRYCAPSPDDVAKAVDKLVLAGD